VSKAGDPPKRNPRRRYVTVTPSTLASGGLSFARDLWAPFRWETTVSLPDPRHAYVPEVKFGTVVANEEGSEFHGVMVAILEDRLTAFVWSSAAIAPGLQFPGASALDLAVEHDGAQVRFLAREHGEATWQEIAAAAQTQTEAYFPRLDIDFAHDRIVLGFDDFRVVASADPPGAGPTHDGLVHLLRGIDGVLDVVHRLDGTTDLSPLQGDLITAYDSLTVARDAFIGVARQKADEALKKVDRAMGAIERGRPSEKVAKLLRSALDLAFAARAAVAEWHPLSRSSDGSLGLATYRGGRRFVFVQAESADATLASPAAN
jgi:hypothetical protein